MMMLMMMMMMMLILMMMPEWGSSSGKVHRHILGNGQPLSMLLVHLWDHDDQDHDHDDDGDDFVDQKLTKLTQGGVLNVLKVLVEGAGKLKMNNEMHNKIL